LTLFEQIVVGDDNDVDRFGMDANTRKRLGLKYKASKGKKMKPRRPIQTKMPRDLADIDEAVLSERVWFSTLGSKGKGTKDPVGYVTSQFFHSTPELEKSLVDVKQNRNGWIVQGSWPSSGPQVFDWELETWGERGGAVVVKFNMWSARGRMDGQNYRTTVATVDKLVPKFLKKVFYPTKAAMKREVGAKIGKREDWMESLRDSICLLDSAISILSEGFEAKTIMPGPMPSLRRNIGAKDIRIKPGDITKETRITPEDRLSVVAYVPRTGKSYTVKTRWFGRDTAFDSRRVQSTVRAALSKYLSTGKGLQFDSDGNLLL
jgi:hypothetical protein